MSGLFNFETATPESQGVPSEAIQEFLDILVREHFELHGLIISRHEKIIAEGYFKPYAQDTLHRLFSAAKSVNMTAVLCMIQEGRLRPDDRMCDLLPEMMPEEITDRLSRLTLYHLLCMATGHGAEGFFFLPPYRKHPVKQFFEMPLVYEPGKKFIYNNGVPGVLEYLIKKITGEDVVTYLKPRVFDALGIDRTYTFVNGGTLALPNLALETRDMFKLAMLFARGGNWEGKQLIRKDLAELAAKQHVPNGDFDIYPAPPENLSGYCWQMWRNPPGGYRFDGAMGQYAVVLPEFDMVIAMNANERGSYDVLALIWKILLRKIYLRPLEENPEAFGKLQETLEELNLAPKGDSHRRAEGIYQLSETAYGCSKLSFNENDDGILLRADDKPEILIRTGGVWTGCEMPFAVPDLDVIAGHELPDDMGPLDPRQAVASGAWIGADTLEVHFRSSAWLGGYAFCFRFTEEGLEMSVQETASENFILRSEEMKDWGASAGWLKEPEKIPAVRISGSPERRAHG